MAILSHSETVTSSAAVQLNEGDAVELMLRTDQSILIGGPDAQTFPVSAAEDIYFEIDVGVGETLWAKAVSTTATVEVLEQGV